MAEREGMLVHSKIHIGEGNHKFMRVVVKRTLSSSRKHLKPSLFVTVPKLILSFTNKLKNLINSALLNGLNYDT